MLGTLIVPDNRRVQVDLVADSANGYDGGQSGERDIFRISGEGLSYRTAHDSEQIRPVPDGHAWIKTDSLTQSRRFVDCASELPYRPYEPPY